MKNKWIYFFTGNVQVVIEGVGTERFINDCVRERIFLWDVKRHRSGKVSFFIRLQDVHALRKVVRRNDCTCTFLKRKGLPFWIKRSYKNSGFLIGMTCFFIIAFLLSNMVWGIEIQGAEPKTEHLVEKELKKIGIKTGAFQFLLPEPDDIQKYVLDEVEGITWIGVDLVGTTYHIEVVEKKEPPEKEYVGPQHIVASKEAVISRMFVEKGQQMVSIHEHVQKGQILVSGIIGNEKNEQLVGAKGEVYGETWYETVVKVPLESTYEVLTGNYITKHKIDIYGFSVPFWGFKKNEYKQFEKEVTNKPFHFLHWTLPISYVNETYRESETVTKKYTKEEVKEKGLNLAKKNLKEKLGEKDEIKEEKVLQERNENGKVKMKILFQVIEDIVETKPIVQGD
ncbi:sporulation protein YqfD [Bacillus sp. FJAT-47783]|uniref:sporulation protein YqfD n=1 Tax=Bacillus sp. FJAT-47783 TaxID=2922712 RepID=UPI001FADF6C5|nr:sporulation protein YqfD [Bacillus sp. FJAT-47783]